jgi:hypothetical protein
MKSLTATLLFASNLLTSGAAASDWQSIPRPELAPATIGEAVQSLRAPLVRSAAVRTEVISIDSRDSSFLIPIAGNTAASNGTYFRSDVVIANYRASEQRVGVGWMAAGQDNTHSLLTYFTIPSNTVLAQDDFVAQVLGKTGLGGVVVFGVDAIGNNDSTARLDGFSRIWTYQPGSAGTVSQNFDAVSLLDSIGSLTAYLVGLKQSADFRTNIGVVNLDSVAHVWTAKSVQTGAITTISVPPYSVVQTGLAPGSASGVGNVALTLISNGFGFWWSAYGSTVDNRTGDGWVARAKQ